MMSIKIMYNSSSLFTKTTKVSKGKFDLLLQFVLNAVNVDALTNLQDVFCHWRVYNEDLPRARNENASEDGSDHVDDSDVEDHKVGRVGCE